MGEALIRASYSTNVKERRDCSTILFDARGRTLGQAEHIPIHLGSLMGIVEDVTAALSRRRDPRPGDMFIGNDAYTGGGTHLPDIVVVAPVFVEGEVVAWVANIAHHADFVDRGHAHIFQEGLRIPPVRIYRGASCAGRAGPDPAQLPGAARAPQRSARADGGQPAGHAAHVQALCATGTARDWCWRPATRCSTTPSGRPAPGSARFRTGVYSLRGPLRHDEIADEKIFRSRSGVRGDEIELDFESPPQVRAGLNMVWTALLATVYYAVKTLVDPTFLPNAGMYRPIHGVAAPARWSTAWRRPPSNSRTQTCQRVVDLILGALAQAVPERVIAACTGAYASSPSPASTRAPAGTTPTWRRSAAASARGRPRTASTACRCTSPTPRTCRSRP